MKDIFKYLKPEWNRREFIKKMLLGSALGSVPLIGCSSNLKKSPKPSRSILKREAAESTVSFVTGTDRRQMIIDVLKPHENYLKEALINKKVFIKINCVVDSCPLIATHPDSVRGILDFLKPIYNGPVTIGESTVSNKGTYYTFEQYGFLPLEKEYGNVKLVELNNEPTTYQWILDKDLYPTSIRVINNFLDPDNFIISVTRLKTHNVVVATLSLKNVVMGSPLKIPSMKISDKSKMHATGDGNNSPKMLNYNLFLLAHKVYPDFSVLDGFEGVEGNGPTTGEPVDHKVALAGPDYVSVDRLGSELMGIPWENLGYLNYCADSGLGQGDRSKIKIIGPSIDKHVIKYKLNENIDWQMSWKDDLVIQPKK